MAVQGGLVYRIACSSGHPATTCDYTMCRHRQACTTLKAVSGLPVLLFVGNRAVAHGMLCTVCAAFGACICSIGLQGSEGIGLVSYNSATLVTLGK